MPARYKSRQRALQVLFQCDIRDFPAAEGIRAFHASLDREEDDEAPEEDPFMEQLVGGTRDGLASFDALIARHSTNWRLDRMPLVDRNILRMGIYEMLDLGTPAPIVIDQAITLARRFSSEESVPFINGILDAVLRAQNAAASEAPAEPATGE